MEPDDREPGLAWHLPEGTVGVWWDVSAPLPDALVGELRLRFPEAPWLVVDDSPAVQAGAPPAWLAALAPDLAECFVEYADKMLAAEDSAGARALVPHLAALVRVVERLARVGAGEPLIPLTHRLRAGWVRALYAAGRYAEGWAQSANLPAALAAHAAEAERRVAWVYHGLLALETGRHAEAGEAFSAAERLAVPAGDADQAGWLLALGQADLAAACEQDQVALAAYTALADLPGAPAWARARACVGQSRVWARSGRADAAAPLVEAAQAIGGAGWSAGLPDLAAAELALLCGHPAQALSCAAAARVAASEHFGAEHPSAGAAALVEAQALYAAGDFGEADRLIGASLPVLQAGHGSAHLLVAQALTLQGLLAGVRGATNELIGDLAAAQRAARQLAETSDSAEITADLLECTIALAQGRADRAAAAAGRALEYARTVLDAAHPLAAACLDAVAECERARGRWSVARVYGDMALSVRRSVFGAEHPLTATSHELLGHIYLDARAYTSAREAFELAARVRRAALGPAHPLTAEAQLGLARAAVALGDLAGAQAAAAGALGGLERAYGAGHPATRAARSLLAHFSSPLRRGWWIARARLRRLHTPA
jgi:hypothetical protein